MIARRSYLLASLGVLLLTTKAVAQSPPRAEPPAKIAAFLRQCEASRRGTMANLEHALRGLRAQQPQTAANEAKIKKLETELATLRTNKAPFVPPLSFPLEKGAIGRLPRLGGHVVQIVSQREILCRCVFPLKVTSVRHFQPQGEVLEQSLMTLFRGVDTRQLHEGDDIELLQVFEVSGKRTFDTEDGHPTTVWLLDLFDMKQIEPFFHSDVAPQPARP